MACVYRSVGPDNLVAAAPGLGRLTQLTGLSLDLGSLFVSTAQVNAMVRTLPQLQRLRLDFCDVALTEGFPLALATSCTHLRFLFISGSGELQRGAVPRDLGDPSRLTALTLMDVGVTSLLERLSRLTALQKLYFCYNQDLSQLPQGLWALTGLTALGLASRGLASLPDSISNLRDLQMVDLSDSDADFVLPTGLTACRKLTDLFLGTDRASPVLAKLQSLRWLSVDSMADQKARMTYWTQLTALTFLQLDCKGRRSVPRGLEGLAGLRSVNIVGAAVGDLPLGPSLRGLTSLSLGRCTFLSGVPSSLGAAMNLQEMRLGDGGI